MTYAVECPLCQTLIVFDEAPITCTNCGSLMVSYRTEDVPPGVYSAKIELLAR